MTFKMLIVTTRDIHEMQVLGTCAEIKKEAAIGLQQSTLKGNISIVEKVAMEGKNVQTKATIRMKLHPENYRPKLSLDGAKKKIAEVNKKVPITAQNTLEFKKFM